MSSDTTKKEQEDTVVSPDVDFKPLVNLPLIDTNTLEDNEDELLKLRAKLFRFECTSEPPEWKERGVGEVKLMKNKTLDNIRLIMRRDKTHKICANHLITPDMKLVPSAGSDRAWVWTTLADFSDEEPKREQLAIRFRNAEIAQKFKEEFEKCQTIVVGRDEGDTNGIEEILEKLSMSEKNGLEGVVAASQSKESNGNRVDESKPLKSDDENTPPGSETVLDAITGQD